LLWQLVHYHTILNRHDREEMGYKKWRSDRLDLLSSMVLLEELVELSREEIEYNVDAELLVLLLKYYKSGERFTSSMAYRRLTGIGFIGCGVWKSLYRLCIRSAVAFFSIE